MHTSAYARSGDHRHTMRKRRVPQSVLCVEWDDLGRVFSHFSGPTRLKIARMPSGGRDGQARGEIGNRGGSSRVFRKMAATKATIPWEVRGINVDRPSRPPHETAWSDQSQGTAADSRFLIIGLMLLVRMAHMATERIFPQRMVFRV